jgi:hypothetical protein
MAEQTTFCQPGCEGLLAEGNRREELSRKGHRTESMDREIARFHLWAQTPHAVWDAYAESGYTIH